MNKKKVNYLLFFLLFITLFFKKEYVIYVWDRVKPGYFHAPYVTKYYWRKEAEKLGCPHLYKENDKCSDHEIGCEDDASIFSSCKYGHSDKNYCLIALKIALRQKCPAAVRFTKKYGCIGSPLVDRKCLELHKLVFFEKDYNELISNEILNEWVKDMSRTCRIKNFNPTEQCLIAYNAREKNRGRVPYNTKDLEIYCKKDKTSYEECGKLWEIKYKENAGFEELREIAELACSKRQAKNCNKIRNIYDKKTNKRISFPK